MKLLTWLLICTLPFISGCVERKLYIKSNPSGAKVTLNHEVIGNTPLEHTFYHYGLYGIQLEKEGFEPFETHARINGPWYETFPIDFVAQVLPIHKTVEHTLEYTLEAEKVVGP